MFVNLPADAMAFGMAGPPTPRLGQGHGMAGITVIWRRSSILSIFIGIPYPFPFHNELMAS